MLYRDLSPIWIISALDKDSGKVFSEKMERQLRAFSENEFGNAFDIERDRWWRIDNINEVANLQIDDMGYPAEIPVYKKTGGDNVDVTCLNVVVFGFNGDFGKCLSIVKELREKRRKDVFMIGEAARVRYYGLLSFKKGEEIDKELKNLMDAPKKSKKKVDVGAFTKETLFNSIFLQGSCNRIEGNGTDFSYPALVDATTGERNDWDLSVQVIYHLALTDGTLSHVNQKLLNVVGAFALNYEPSKEKNSYAVQLTNEIMTKFTTEDKGEHWLNESEATLEKEFEEAQGWRTIYGQLKMGYKDLETDDLVPKSKMSPWEFLRRELIPYYFKKYIKGLVHHVRENVDGFSLITMNAYKNHVDNQFEHMTRDDEQRKRIESELLRIWDKENVDNVTVGMNQFQSRLATMKSFFESQQNKVQDLYDGKTADGGKHEFPELKDYPLGNFGEYQDCYEKYVRNVDASTSKDKAADPIGDGLLQKTRNILSFHPVPLSFLVRAVLAGVLIPIVIWTILKFIPDDTVLDTAFLESPPGSYILLGVCLLICIGGALLKYGFGVVGKVRDNLRNYVAWRLYRMQMEAYRLTLKKEKNYYQQGLDICAEIKANCDLFVDKNNVVTLQEDSCDGFEANMFQANVMKDFEDHGILNNGVLMSRIKTVINKYGEDYQQEESVIPNRNEETDELHYGIFRKTVVVDDNNGIKDYLKRILFGHNSDVDYSKIEIDMKREKEKFYRIFSEKIAQDISFYVGDRVIHSLDDIVFDNAGHDNFRTWKQGDVENFAMFDIVRERSYPSASVDTSAYQYASIVIPSRMFDRWRNKLDLSADVGDNYNTCKGSYEISVLQGFALENLSSIKDFKNA